MNKRGQIYLLAALIIAVSVFSIASIVNWVEYKQVGEGFEKLAQNYESESTKFVNSLFNEEISNDLIFDAFFEFTIKFSSYAKSQSPGFGLIHAFNGNETSIQIGNFFDREVLIDFDDVINGNEQLLSGCYEKIDASVSFGGFSFSLENYADFRGCMGFYDIPVGNMLYIIIDGIRYPFDIVIGGPEVMIISRLEEGKQRKVFIGGKGFNEGENE